MSASAGSAARKKAVALEAWFLERRNPEKAATLAKFFKTGEGEYGYGDHFLGLAVPTIHQAAKLFEKDFSLELFDVLFAQTYHEIKFFALDCLVRLYGKTEEPKERLLLFEFYLERIRKLNNWDYIDVSAHKILGHYLYHYTPKQAEKTLLKLAASNNLWERRAAMVSTAYFIKQQALELPLKVAEALLGDKEDLIHKAVGWMLRELGKKDTQALLHFLERHYAKLPRTTLRYAIEKFDPKTRAQLLQGKF